MAILPSSGEISFADIGIAELDSLDAAKILLNPDPPYSLQDFYGVSVLGMRLSAYSATMSNSSGQVLFNAESSNGITHFSKESGHPAFGVSDYSNTTTSMDGKHSFIQTGRIVSISYDGSLSNGDYDIIFDMRNDAGDLETFTFTITLY